MPKAYFTDGHAFYCMFRSKSQGGVYLVKVEEEVEKLCVTHSCPAIRVHGKCHHIEKSVNAYYSWRWWDEPVPESKIMIKTEYLSLDPNWKQVVFPKEFAEVKFEDIHEGGGSLVTRHTRGSEET